MNNKNAALSMDVPPGVPASLPHVLVPPPASSPHVLVPPPARPASSPAIGQPGDSGERPPRVLGLFE